MQKNHSINTATLSRNPYLCRPFTSSGDGARLTETKLTIFVKGKILNNAR
ncbi:MAG: hypothetical protein ABIT58_04365 [Ferruginibacter sp.]